MHFPRLLVRKSITSRAGMIVRFLGPFLPAVLDIAADPQVLVRYGCLGSGCAALTVPEGARGASLTRSLQLPALPLLTIRFRLIANTLPRQVAVARGVERAQRDSELFIFRFILSLHQLIHSFSINLFPIHPTPCYVVRHRLPRRHLPHIDRPLNLHLHNPSAQHYSPDSKLSAIPLSQRTLFFCVSLSFLIPKPLSSHTPARTAHIVLPQYGRL